MLAQTQTNFIEDATKSGYIDTARAKDLVQLYKSYQGQGILRGIDEVAVEHGFMTSDQVAEIRNLRERAGKVPGARVGPYETIEKIGAGGMAEVFKARDTRNGQIVALKVLHRRLSEDKDYLQRFYREAQAAAKLHHPNIIRAFEAARTPDGQHYFAMEYVEGTTLNAWLKKTTLIPQREAIKIGIQVVKALDHAHSQGIVHRDIKPDNIMVTRDGRVKVTDLGLAKQYSDNSVTEIGVAIGTPQYISPEQARGDSTIDIRSDIYSLGATLYHAVTGYPPFTGNSAAIIMVKHLKDTPAWPLELNPTLLESTAQILMKMLAKHPAERYQTPKELLRDMSAVYHGLKSSASATVSAVHARGGTPTVTRLSARSTNFELPLVGQPSIGGTRRLAELCPTHNLGKTGRGKFVFLGVCISLTLCLSVFTAVKPQWLKVFASAIGLAKPPSEIVDDTAQPVVSRKSAPNAPETPARGPEPSGKPLAQPSPQPPLVPPRGIKEIPLVPKTGTPAPGSTAGKPGSVTSVQPVKPQPAQLPVEIASAIEGAKQLAGSRNYVAAYALLSGLRDREKPDAKGVYSFSRTTLEQEMDAVRASAEPFLTAEIERAKKAVESNDMDGARKAIASARGYLTLNFGSRYASQLTELESRTQATSPATSPAGGYSSPHSQYGKVVGMVKEREYDQAIHFLRTLNGANADEVALWEAGIRDVQDIFRRAEANASTLVGTNLKIGQVSGKVVAVEGGKLHIQAGDVRLARSLSELPEKQQLELAGIRSSAEHPDTKVRLGVLAFFTGQPAMAKAYFEQAQGSQLPLIRLLQTLKRMDNLAVEGEAFRLFAEAQKLAKSGDWRKVREKLTELHAKYSNTAVVAQNESAIAVMETQMESENLEGALAGNVRRKDALHLEITYPFRRTDELWDWWRSGSGLLNPNGGLDVNGDFWMCHRAAYARVRTMEVHFRVEKLLDPANSSVGWGVHTAAQFCTPTAIETDLPRGFFGLLSSLQGRESGIWVGGDQPKAFAVSRQNALKPATDYVLTVTHGDDKVAWALNGEIFLKANDLGARPGPRVILMASQVQMTIKKVVIDGNIRSNWLMEAKNASEFLSAELPKVRKQLEDGEAVSLLHGGLPLLWSAAPGEWKTANGQTVWESYYNAPAMRLPFMLKNGVLEVKFCYAKEHALQRGFEVSFRDTGASRYALRVVPAKAQLALVRYAFKNGVQEEEILKQSAANEIAPDVWHPVAVAFKDGRVCVNFHNTPVLAYNEARPCDGEISLGSVQPGSNSVYQLADFTLRPLK